MRKLLLIFCIILLIIMSFIGYLFVRYSSWIKGFESNTNIICISDEEELDQSEELNISEKIKDFVLSDYFSEFVTFTKKEILIILYDSINSSSELDIQDICLDSQKGIWKLFIHSKFNNIQLPWLGLDIVKDSRETAELYSRNIYLGDMKVPLFLSKNILEKINKGISDALVLVLENGFLGKDIINIDLLFDSVVLKGSF